MKFVLHEVLEQVDLGRNEFLCLEPRSRYLELNDGRQVCWVVDTFYVHDEITVYLAVGQLRYVL